jgi:tRNA-uridine 2-sulfurtransferase
MRILAAMSGGVDSSVVAALLAGAGHEVIGVTLQLYDHGATSGRKGACCAGQDIHDARRVADHLGIPHYVVDREARFRAAVVDDFARSYAEGRTPVPCVRCNQTVKFQDLVALADDLGAEAVATGHYARRVDGRDGPELHRAADLTRDQSWFLFATTPAQLARVRFPLGEWPDKAAVRVEAEARGLPVAAKPDSQDLCFVPTGRYADLVARLRPDAAEPGEIVTEDGRILGQHRGVAGYTVGQRRGLGEASWDGVVRQQVVSLDAARRRVVVGSEHAGTRHLQLSEVNWLSPNPRGGVSCAAKLRAREAPQPATLWLTEEGADVELATPALPAPGQACVLYDGSRVLGGGFIRSAPA